MITYIVLAGITGAVLIGFYFFLRVKFADRLGKASAEQAKVESEQIVAQASLEAKQITISAQEEVLKLKSSADKEMQEMRSNIAKLEEKILAKEEELASKFSEFASREQKLKSIELEVSELKSKYVRSIEDIAKLSQQQAKEMLLKQIESDLTHDKAVKIKAIETEYKQEAHERAMHIVMDAIQQCALDYTIDNTVAVVSLPNDEVKGRIIGREGRNIRTIESLTGCDLIIDDTPETIVVSGFDPVRRQVAKLALERLIQDGRIHPVSIEETISKATIDINKDIQEAGEEAVMQLKLRNIHPELIKLIGRLKYRTSYGQNLLQHSIEVANICGIIAAEIGSDIERAKRVGLLHDIGKAMDHEIEGSHAIIGFNVAKQYGEPDIICHAIGAHHADMPQESIEDILAQIGDAISASRPGARRDSREFYIQRLQKLEEIANGFPMVDKTYAMRAGRELRVLVKSDQCNDDQATILSHDIAKKIENDMQYPGQIKVTVIRETRVSSLAN